MNDRTTSIYYINALLSGLKRHGKNADALLEKFSITEEALSNPSTRVSFEVFCAFTRYSWKTLKDENMGFGNRPLANGCFYYASKMAVGTKNLEDALSLLTGFYSYIDHGYSMKLVNIGDDVELQAHINQPELDTHHMLADFIVVASHRFSCWLTGKHVEVKSVSFDFPSPKHEAEYGKLFSCPKIFNADRLCIRFSAEYLKSPIVRNNLELEDYIAVTPMNILLNPVMEDNFTTKVKRYIESNKGTEFPTFDSVACALHMVPKTLRQKLKVEGGSYQKIKDNIRRDLAIYCLYQANYTVADIAEKVGFTETGAFIRAFKNWTGHTPGVYRKEFVEDL